MTEKKLAVTMGSLSSRESHIIYNKLYDYLLLLSSDSSNVYSPNRVLEDLLSCVESLARSKNRQKILKYYLLNVAETPVVAWHRLGIPEPSLYRGIKHLVKDKFLVWAIKPVIKKNYQGRHPGVVAIPFYSKDDLVRAIERYKIEYSPEYKFTNRMYQLVLDEYLEPDQTEVDYTEFRDFMKKQCSGLSMKTIIQVTDNIASKLAENQGLKVRR